MPYEPLVAVQYALGAMGFRVAEINPAHHGANLAAGLILDLGDVHGMLWPQGLSDGSIGCWGWLVTRRYDTPGIEGGS